MKIDCYRGVESLLGLEMGGSIMSIVDHVLLHVNNFSRAWLDMISIIYAGGQPMSAEAHL